MDVKIIASNVVRPSSPTPAHRSSFNLSLVDQMADHNFVPFIFLYNEFPNRNTMSSNFAEKCRQLKSSLSRTLSLFYPIAGRIRDNCSIDCCDSGVEFVEAELNCPMSHFLVSSPHQDLIRPLVPVNRDPMRTEFLCLIQVTLFDCGGLAICFCLTHKIADGVTYMRFIQTWATIARKWDSGRVETPDLGLANLLPADPDLKQPSFSRISNNDGKILTRRFFFSAPKLEELKRRASSGAVDKPTRVEAVLGLIWKCAITASSATTMQHSAVVVAVNLRERLVPLVSKNTVGNLLGVVVAKTATSIDHNISNQVIALRTAKEVFGKRFEGIVMSGEGIKPLLWFETMGELFSSKVEIDRLYSVSSICGVPIHFDFGWGGPRLVIPSMFVKNTVMLMDADDLRGVQAYVTLEEQEMNCFQKDQDLLSFASLTLTVNSPPKPKM